MDNHSWTSDIGPILLGISALIATLVKAWQIIATHRAQTKTSRQFNWKKLSLLADLLIGLMMFAVLGWSAFFSPANVTPTFRETALLVFCGAMMVVSILRPVVSR